MDDVRAHAPIASRHYSLCPAARRRYRWDAGVPRLVLARGPADPRGCATRASPRRVRRRPPTGV